MNTKIEVKLADNQGNELPSDMKIEKLSPGLQQFLRLLVDEIFAEDMKDLEAKNRQKKKPLKIKGFCSASPRGFYPPRWRASGTSSATHFVGSPPRSEPCRLSVGGFDPV